MKNLKLMADYFCWPLWRPVDEGGNIDPASLPLSRDLVIDLLVWAADWDAILNMDDPASSDFASPEDEDEFNAEGRALATRLADQLAGEFEVSFQDTHGKRVVIDPPGSRS